jgi:hypothetical protein
MLEKTTLRWPPQPSTVIGFGILAGSLCYFITGDPIWAGLVAGVVKILVPDNSTAARQVLGAIAAMAQAVGRPLQTPAQPLSSEPADQGSSPRLTFPEAASK